MFYVAWLVLRVSNPHRYGQRTATGTATAHNVFNTFQTLIGTVKGGGEGVEPESEDPEFQTLIGTVKGGLWGGSLQELTEFQTLIGTVKGILGVRWDHGQGVSNPHRYGQRDLQAQGSIGGFKPVSNPHRYGQRSYYDLSEAQQRDAFQTLIGTVKGVTPSVSA